MTSETSPDLSVLTTLYFEEECVAEFVRNIRLVLDPMSIDYELIMVDDGSGDSTVKIVEELALADPRIKLVELSANCGKEAAITAGITYATGARIVMLDADLQDPPEFIPSFIEKLDEGYDLVFGLRDRKADTFSNVIFSRLFWALLNGMTGLAMPKNLAVMRIFTRRFADAFLAYPERSRFIEGIFMQIGMRRSYLVIPNRARFAGASKFNGVRKIRLALNAVVSFSDRPLKISIVMGSLMCLLSALVGVNAVVSKLVFHVGQLGWTSVITAITFVGGVQVVVLGVTGLYVGRIYSEVKQRPLFHVQRTLYISR
jgi:dolichol-phosphate mannosyltransferase